MRIAFACGLLCAVALASLAPAPVLAQVSEPTKVSPAVALDSQTLLTVPAALQEKVGKEFEIATVAPAVTFTKLTDLEDRGKGTLWSSWGDGCVASNGKYYTSCGDHLGRGATCRLYEFDPVTKAWSRVCDVAVILHTLMSQYGHGKIHSGIHEGADGWLYFSTYWGKHREVDAAFGPDFQGSIVMRYNPKNGKVEDLGAITPKHGLPASAFDKDRGLLYFHVVYDKGIAVYDVKKQERIFWGGEDIIAGNRTFLPGVDGRMFMTGKGGQLYAYVPEKNALVATNAKLPGEKNSLRSAVQFPRSELLYGMTYEGRLFSFNAKSDEIKDLGPNFEGGIYTAAMVQSPDGKSLYYLPGAHGSSARNGTPLVRYDIPSGKRTVLAFLAEPVRNTCQWNLGGTYNLQIDATGQRLFTTFNGDTWHDGTARQTGFGEIGILTIDLASEKK